jgi:glycolate oxidase
MTTIHELNPRDRLAVVEAGVITADLDQAAAEYGLLYAPDPASHQISTIGGNLATNAGGLRCLKYGVTRDAVLGLEAVLADGRVIRTGGRTVKGVVGYDLTRLLVGSEGTLAVIATATVRLRPRPIHRPATFAAAFPTIAAAGNAALAIVNAGLQPNLLELMDRDTCRAVADLRNQKLEVDAAAWLIGQSDSSDATESTRSMVALCKKERADVAWATDDENEAEAFLSMRRMAYPAVERLGLTLVEDVVVPLSRLADLLVGIQDIARRYDIRIPTVAHAGDGNAHPVVVVPRDQPAAPMIMKQTAQDIYRLALDFRGTVTGEHGVGLLKREWLNEELDDTSLSVQRAIKTILDPRSILNPGKGI